jgi:hypothetical protein
MHFVHTLVTDKRSAVMLPKKFREAKPKGSSKRSGAKEARAESRDALRSEIARLSHELNHAAQSLHAAAGGFAADVLTVAATDALAEDAKQAAQRADAALGIGQPNGKPCDCAARGYAEHMPTICALRGSVDGGSAART